MTIVLTAVLFTAGAAVAQTPGITPDKKPQQWNADSIAKKNSADSSIANWQQPAPVQKPVDTAALKKPLAEPVTDRVMMKEGMMVIIKDGNMAPMDKEITLPSGTVVQTDGTLKKKDGSEIKLKNGQYIELPSADAKKKTDQKDSR